MLRSIIAMIVFGCVAVSGLPAKPVKQEQVPKQAAKDGGDKQSLQGVWLLTRIESSGHQVFPLKKAKKAPDSRFIFNGDNFIMDDEPSGTFKVNGTVSPKQIDFMDPKTGKVWTLGIYKVEAGTLSLCWETETNRPSGFKTAMERKEARLLTLIRQVPTK